MIKDLARWNDPVMVEEAYSTAHQKYVGKTGVIVELKNGTDFKGTAWYTQPQVEIRHNRDAKASADCDVFVLIFPQDLTKNLTGALVELGIADITRNSAYGNKRKLIVALIPEGYPLPHSAMFAKITQWYNFIPQLIKNTFNDYLKYLIKNKLIKEPDDIPTKNTMNTILKLYGTVI